MPRISRAILCASVVFALALSANARMSIQEVMLYRIRHCFFEFEQVHGCFPLGSNAEVVRQLLDDGIAKEWLRENLDDRGNLLDLKKEPYVFLSSPDGWIVIATMDHETGSLLEWIIIPPPDVRARTSERVERFMNKAEPGATDNPDDAR